VTRLLALALVVLTALVTIAMAELACLAGALWTSVGGGSDLSFDWIAPLPAAGIFTAAVLVVGFLVSRFMGVAGTDLGDEVVAKQLVRIDEPPRRLRSA
jgi:hypothetical protein